MNMKRLLLLVAFFATLHASAQQVNPVPDYVFANRMSAGRNTVTDTAAYFSIGPRYGATRGMMPPMVVDTASFSGNKRNGLLIFSVQKNKFLYWDSVGVKWAEMAGTGGSAIAGTGTTNYLPKFTGTTTIGNSQVFDNGTNVGIGSTSPVSGLEIRRPGNSSHLAFTRSTSSGNANVRLGENILNLVFENNSATELARLNINGELLVGSSIDTGDYKLQITGNIYGSGTTILSRSSGNVGVGLLLPTGTTDKYINIFGTSSTELHLTNSGTGTGGSDGFTILQSGNDIYAYNYESGFIIFGTSGTERMRISSGGNVGIGVGTTPVAGLEIQRPGSTDHLTFSRNTSAGNANIKVGGNTLALVFENNSSAELMRLNIGGELIISSTGTDAGDYKLQVAGNIYTTGNLQMTNNASITNTNAQNIDFGTSGSGNLTIRGGTIPTSHITVQNGGNIGIGTTTVNSKVQISTQSGTTQTLGDWASSIVTIQGASRTGTTAVDGSFATTLSLQSNDDVIAASSGASIGFSAKWNSGLYASAAQFASIFGGKESGADASLAGYLSFATRPSGGNPTERGRINSAGEWIIDASGTDAGDYKLQVVGNTLLNGNLRTAAPSGGTANDWRLGTVATVSPTSPNRTIEVSIGGTIYYIHAKTTND